MQGERNVAIAELKSHLSAEIRRVREGETITIVDHRKPVARLTGLGSIPGYVRRRQRPFVWRGLQPLMVGEVQDIIDRERADSW
ncbi:MAG: hypothetical protein CVV51_08380 [Spirochaetae bacterium HGW-Spirochaetae-7]|nr:MAG: hypothetical protein CVV51_08380 [Spirochaetae bacterium HGW-Spirochaetae-7]